MTTEEETILIILVHQNEPIELPTVLAQSIENLVARGFVEPVGAGWIVTEFGRAAIEKVRTARGLTQR